jgi:hypothetical protein
MKHISRYTLGVIALAVFAGCASQVAPTGGAPQLLAPATHGKSWMLPEAKAEDLLYVSNSGGTVYVYSYPTLTPVGQLDGMGNVATEGLCVDKQGDVFVPAWTGSPTTGYIYEFSHGGTEPIETLTDGTSENSSCSVDHTTGNLAVANFQGVEIFQNAQGTPTAYSVPNIEPEWAAYDDSGNLFADGRSTSGQPLAELPKGGSSFETISLNKSISIESLQWYKGYLAAASGNGNNFGPLDIYQMSISGGSGTILGTTTLKVKRKIGYDGNGQYLIQGGRIFGAGEEHNSLQIWRYPAGGNAVKTVIKKFSPWGVALSPASSKK